MTRVADASLVAGVTAAAHSIVFQFTLTFRFPFDTVVEREPPACSPFYCRGYIGLLHARFQPNYLILWEISLVQVGQESKRSRRGWVFLPTFTRLGHGDKEELSGKRDSLTANLISARNICSRLFWTFVGLIEAN